MPYDRIEAAVVHANATLNALRLVDHMRILDGTGDSADRAVTCAQGAALTCISDDLILQERLALAGRAGLLGNMCDVFIFERSQRGQDRVRSRLAKAAQSGVADDFGKALQLFQMLQCALAVRDIGQQFGQACGTNAARCALTAGLFLCELKIELSNSP